MSAALVPILSKAIRHDLGISTFGALCHIAEHSETRLSDLARLLGVSGAAMTLMADRLEERSLAYRRDVIADRRSYTLEITREGRALIAKILS